MTVRASMLLLIVGMGLVTFLPRVLPLVTLGRVALPDWIERWLAYVPVAVISALLAVEVLPVEGGLARVLVESHVVPVTVVVLVALLRGSLIVSVAAGVVTAALLQLL